MEFKLYIDHFRVTNVLSSHIAHFLNEREWKVLENAPVLYYVFEYTPAPKNYDLLEQLPEDLRTQFLTNPRYKLVIDYRTEGAPYQRRDFYSMLYHTRDKYNLPSKKFAFWTSNLKEQSAYKKWALEHNRDWEQDPIRYVVWNFWQSDARRYVAPEHNKNQEFNFKRLDSTKRIESSFLCMNRRPHIHRRLLQAELFRTGHYQKILMSGDRPSLEMVTEIGRDWPVDGILAVRMAATMPWLLDTDTLEHNLVNTAPLSLYERTSASIVTESENTNFQDCMMFFSEKTFKAMLFGHPILILGTPNQNHYLKHLGFELFEDYFDYAYDREPALWDRVCGLANQVRSIVDSNSILKIKADPAVQERIKHNRDIIIRDEFNRKPSRDFLKWIEIG